MKKSILGLSILSFAVIVLLPIIYLAVSAFVSDPKVFHEFLKNVLSRRALLLIVNSLITAGGATLLATSLGLPLGFLIARTDIYFKKVFSILFLLPILIPPYVAAIAWINLFSEAIQGIAGAVFVLGLSYFPFITLLSIAGLLSIDRKLEEQAELIASPQQILSRITMPMIQPFIAAGTLFVFIFSLSNYSVPSLLQVNTYPIEIFAQFSAFYNHKLAVLTSLPLLLITAGLLAFAAWQMEGRSFVNLETSSQKPKIFSLKKYRGLCSLLTGLVILISGVLPLIVLVVTSGSLKSYGIALKTSLRPIEFSLLISSVSASVCVVFGFFLAYILERQKNTRKALGEIVSILPLAIPPTVLGIGMIKTWNRPATNFIYSHLGILVFALTGCFIAFAIKTLASNFQQINRNMEEAAELSGAGFVKTVWKILIPLNRRGLCAAWTICFIFCMGECGATLMVAPPGVEMLSTKIYTLMHYGAGKLTSALCVILVFVSLLPVLGLSPLLRKDPWG